MRHISDEMVEFCITNSLLAATPERKTELLLLTQELVNNLVAGANKIKLSTGEMICILDLFGGFIANQCRENLIKIGQQQIKGMLEKKEK